MLIALPHFQWQVLRAVLRAEAAGRPPLGRDLRVTPTRRTKDGTFLDELVGDGLLAVVGRPESRDERDEPEPFRRRYALTDLGRHAAEYGEYDRPYTPGDAPLTGTAAEILESLAARKVWARRASGPAAVPEAEPGKGAARGSRSKR